MRNFELKRKMGDYIVTQRTKDCMFCASALLKQWNNARPDLRPKHISEFLKNNKTIEFIETIRQKMWEERHKCNSLIISDTKKCTTDNQLVTNMNLLPDIPCMVELEEVVIIRKGAKTSTGQTPDEVWMHPMLFIDFAMWLNPRFKYDVIKFVYDHLVEYRNRIADLNRHWTDVLHGLGCVESKDYAIMTDLLNMAVFGHTEPEIMDSAVDTQLDGMIQLVEKYKFAFDNGWLTTLEQLQELLQKEYEGNFGKDI